MTSADGMPDPADTTSGAEGVDTCQFVTFRLGEQLYCVEIMSVREIRASSVITALPNAPEYVKGVINLRGAIVPIVDLKARFALDRSPAAQGEIVVIVSIGGRLKGLLVDDVSDILTVGRSEIAAIPNADGEPRTHFFAGLITTGDTMLIVIALDRLTPSMGNQTNARQVVEPKRSAA